MSGTVPESLPKPLVVVSKCLEFAACRYNGAMIPSDVVRSLKPYVEFVPICAEVEIGLGIPRDPIRIVRSDAGLTLVQPATGRDVTSAMKAFVRSFLETMGDVDGFVLKFRSPSCGLKDVKVFPDPAAKTTVDKTAGFLGGAVLERFPLLAVEDEGRLTNFRIREHFLTRIFTLAAFRSVAGSGLMRDLVAFQARNKLLLMAYSQKELRHLGRLVANLEKRPAPEVFAEYREHLRAALAAQPRYTSCINVLMHALGYFSDRLSGREKAHFLDSLEDYREARVPLSVPVGIIKSLIVRFEQDYLAQQSFFEPYPAGLVAITDSGKGRDL